MDHIYDVIIIGGGPGGYSAALYATRSGLDTLVIEKMYAGGQMTETMQIDNYPGFDQGIDGFSLGNKMKTGAEKFGAKTVYETVNCVVLDKEIKVVETNKQKYASRTVVIATGAKHKHLGIESESKYIGKGVGYCAACDGMFYKNKVVAVVGGGNSAVADTLLLSKVAKKVYLIHRRDSLRATKIYNDALTSASNIEIIWNSKVIDIKGETFVNKLTLENVNNSNVSELDVDGVFISIGREPSTELFKGQVELDNHGYIKADESTRTNIDGIYAVGDVRTKALRQIVTAAADGATASFYIEEYLASK
jgi:thioredoxin reductase (NADPH)